jgi:hypothetical protein
MAVRIQETTKADLVAVAVPSYFKGTALSHKFIMDYMESKLDQAGITIESESYRSTADGGVAQCVYKLDKNRIVGWTNSYIQGMRFKSGAGIYLTGDTYMIGDTEPDLIRSVDVDVRVKLEIDKVISDIDNVVNATVQNLVGMKAHTINSIKQSEILGVLYANSKILTSEQAAQVARGIKSGTDFTLSAFYNEIATVLKKSHPKSWMDQQRVLYSYFVQMESNLSKLATEMAKVDPVEAIPVDPAQVNMLDQITQMEEVIKNEGNDMSKAIAPDPDIVEIDPSATTGGTVGTDSGEQHQDVQSNQNDLDIAEIAPPRAAGHAEVDANPTAQVQPIDASAGTEDANEDSQDGVEMEWENPQPDVVEVEEPADEVAEVEWKQPRVISGTPDADVVDLVLPSRGPAVEGSAQSQEISEGSSKDSIGSGETTDVGKEEPIAHVAMHDPESVAPAPTPDVVEITTPPEQGMEMSNEASSGPVFSFDASDDDENDMDLDL